MQLKIDHSNAIADLEVRRNRYISEVSKAYEEKIENLPFAFDELILLWNDSQANALFFKLVNQLRNKPSSRPYIQRWIDRLEDAKKGIQIPNI